ncbi:MAG TPA: hypothetical protein VJ508_00465 [Saprospiraceae bacterium]|nr:hypothetical protein [Saprospiraceae bacterium]
MKYVIVSFVLLGFLLSGCTVNRRVTVIPAELAAQTEANFTVIELTKRDGMVIRFGERKGHVELSRGRSDGSFTVTGFTAADQTNVVIDSKDIADALVEREYVSPVSWIIAATSALALLALLILIL